ncbi:MAG: WG repeat-containing protein [Flavobacteriales bacterium]|nr:WG repeat-containing protein [Flavobacteriales bacterium]
MKTIKHFFVVAILAVTSPAFSQLLQSKQDEKTQLYGFVNEEDKYVVNPIYKEVDYNFGYREGGIFKVVDVNDKIGFVDVKGKIVVACKYEYTESFENGYAVVRIAKGEYDYLYGLIDSLGKEVIPLKYGRLEYYADDKVLVFGMENASDVGLMNLKGQVLIPEQYAFWSKKITKGLWPVAKNDKCGVVNLKNEIIVPFEYAMIEGYSESLGIAPAQKEENGKFGFIDRTGKTVIPFEYEFGWPHERLISVKKNGKWGLIDINNKIVLPFEYAEIISFYENSVWVIKNEGEEMFELDLITKQKVVKN